MNNAGLKDILTAFPHQQILIIGDVILDIYICGEVHRISPEAPVPVVQMSKRIYVPGGAANVAANVVSLGGQALLGGVIGRDHQGTQLCDILGKYDVDTDGFVVDNTRPTTSKTRIVAQGQQIVRVDDEQRSALTVDQENEILHWAEGHVQHVAACILSDYAKGVISARLANGFMRMARQAGKPVIVDPKGSDYTKYQGATVIAPNVHEAEHASNHKITSEGELIEAGRLLLRLLDGSALLITRGQYGMSLFLNSSQTIHVPSIARNVFDVTGAGDTVVSTLSMALAAGAPLEQATYLANLAAGIVVGKMGTATVTADELQAAI